MKIVLVCIIAYFLGNISSAYIVGKIFGKGMDIRNAGSGNAGATNTLRVLGKRAALLTVIGDIAKGVIAVIIGRNMLGDTGAIVAGISVILGHIYPALLGFRGGKGVATAIGTVFVVQPFVAAICLTVGLTIIALTRYVSLAAMLAVSLFAPLNILMDKPPIYAIYGVIVTIIIIFAHRANVKRLLSGTESKVGQRVKLEDKNE